MPVTQVRGAITTTSGTTQPCTHFINAGIGIYLCPFPVDDFRVALDPFQVSQTASEEQRKCHTEVKIPRTMSLPPKRTPARRSSTSTSENEIRAHHPSPPPYAQNSLPNSRAPTLPSSPTVPKPKPKPKPNPVLGKTNRSEILLVTLRVFTFFLDSAGMALTLMILTSSVAWWFTYLSLFGIAILGAGVLGLRKMAILRTRLVKSTAFVRFKP